MTTVNLEQAQLFSVDKIRHQFPALQQAVRGKPLVYLDNSATTQKPQSVIDALHAFYSQDNANIHRGLHTLSERATKAFENVRQKTGQFIQADSEKEIVFTKGTTEAINLVAHSFLQPRLKPGDEIIVTEMEHHANLVPWQLVAEQAGATIKAIPVLDQGALDLHQASQLFSKRTAFLAVSHVSNVLGTINPVEQLIQMAHDWDVPVLVDGAQAVPHLPIDVTHLNCDFYTFSAHKMYGPTGVGVLYGRYDLLEPMRPYQGGGDMIMTVNLKNSQFKKPPERFEAGTPHIAGVIGLGQAIEFIKTMDVQSINRHENALREYAETHLLEIPGIKIFGRAPEKAAVISFTMEGIHPHDIATVLDTEGVAVRAGHHCAMPLMERFQVPAMLRASMACYNTFSDIDRLIEAIQKTLQLFRGPYG